MLSSSGTTSVFHRSWLSMANESGYRPPITGIVCGLLEPLADREKRARTVLTG